MVNEISESNINPSDLKHLFLSDKPLENLEDDELDRENFSKRLGEIILNYNSEEELILGICGEWGSGKTSVIKMALEYIKNSESEKTLYLVHFNPWLFSNQNQLISKFFEELGSEIKDDTFANSLKSYVHKLVPPILGLATIADPRSANALMSAVKSIENLQSDEESLESLKNKLNNMILEKDCKIIVVIDDIDRLNKTEMLQIFKLVKLLADFPNTIYLLAFDKNVVQESLEATSEFKGLDYLKKVVPIMIDIPSISENDLRDMYLKYMSKLIEDYPNKINSNSLIWVYDNVLKYFIKNIRDLKRYMNNLSFNLELVKKEVNFKDFLSITAIQVFRPDLYEKIWNNKDVFVYSMNSRDNRESERTRQKDIFNKILENEKEISGDEFISILSKIFPKIRLFSEEYDKVPAFKSWPSELRVDKEIQFKEHFDTYFRFSVPKWELSNIEFESILESKDIEEFTNKFLKITDYKKIKFLERISVYLGDIMDFGTKRGRISKEELEILFEFTILRGNILSRYVLNNISRISKLFIELYDKEIKKTKDLINIAENPYPSCLIVNNLEPDKISNLDELKSICADKIEEYICSNGLKNLYSPIYVALCWSKWDDELKVRNVIESLDEDNLRILMASYENISIDSKELDRLKTVYDLQLLKSKLAVLLKKDKLTDEDEILTIIDIIQSIEGEKELII